MDENESEYHPDDQHNYAKGIHDFQYDSHRLIDQDFPDSSCQMYENDQDMNPSRNNDYPARDFEVRRERLRDGIACYNSHEQLRLKHEDFRDREPTVDPYLETQFLRQTMTTQSFLNSINRDDQLASLANYHLEQYQTYVRYMDNSVENGGLDNHFDIITSRFRGQPCQNLWTAGETEEQLFLPSDKEIEDVLCPENEFSHRYQPALQRGYEAMTSQKNPVVRKEVRKKPPGAKNFKAPGKTSMQGPISALFAEVDDIMEKISDAAGVESGASPPVGSPHHRMTLRDDKDDHSSQSTRSVVAPPPKVNSSAPPPKIVTAKDKYLSDVENNKIDPKVAVTSDMYGISSKTLGKRKQPSDRFSPPVKPAPGRIDSSVGNCEQDERMTISKGIDRHIVDIILENVLEQAPQLSLDDIAGQATAKEALEEAVVLPALNPLLFTGLISPVRGVLLYGPPGNGKTMLARALASTCKQTFFNVTASTLASKFVGEGEKLVRALFEVARAKQPSIIFIDEIDSILTTRKESEHDSTRKMKTEFLVQFDGLSTKTSDRVLVVGATNLPHELDSAALRRFPKRIMIPLPDECTRKSMLEKLLSKETNNLSNEHFMEVVKLTIGYSGSDIAGLAKEAAMQRVRDLGRQKLSNATRDQMRPICLKDFISASQKVKPSTSKSSLQAMEEWSKEYGHEGS